MTKATAFVVCFLCLTVLLITTNNDGRVGATTAGQAGVNMCSIRPPTEGEIAISNPSIRLPISNTSEIQFKLSAINGCFKWNSSNTNVAVVTPLHENTERGCDEEVLDNSNTCTKEALVKAVANTNSSCWINAIHTESQRLLRTEVFIDEIVRIEILTTTRMMYRDELEFLMVQGFDDHGNVFNTLEGLKFNWRIESLDKADGEVLQFVKFKDSNFEGPSLLLKMEEEKKEAYAILVKGIEIGKAAVVAELVDPGHPKIKPTRVVLSVREKLRLIPEFDIYVVLNTKVHYQLLLGDKDGSERTIDMPNTNYIWNSEKSDIATVDQLGVATALALGNSRISVQHQNMGDNRVSGRLFVVSPDRLGLRLGEDLFSSTPQWYIVSEHTYSLTIEVYAADKKVYSTKDLTFEVYLSDEYIVSVSRSSNNDHLQIRTLRQGTTYIRAVLVAIANKPLERPISITQQVIISLPLRITRPPNVIVLPWDFYGGQRHQHTLVAVGGSGEYSWSTPTRENIVSVNAHGVVSMINRGSSKVTVVDRRCSTNKDWIEVVVASPGSIFFEPQMFEVEVGSQITLFASMKDEQGRVFQNCSLLRVDWVISDPSVFAYGYEEPVALQGSNCSAKRFLALKEGFSQIKVGYGNNFQLSAEITIFAYNPIRIVSPADGPALVTLGTSATVVFEGGPNPWYLDSSQYFESLEALVEAQPITDGGIPQFDVKDNILISKLGQHPLASGLGGTRHSYQVTCLRHSETVLTIQVGNKPSSTNQFPAKASSTITFTCKPPRVILLFPVRQSPQSSLRSTSDSTGNIASCDSGAFPTIEMVKSPSGATLPTRYRVKNDRVVEVAAMVLDENRRAFHNFSSLVLDWSISNPDLAKFSGDSALSEAGGIYARDLLLFPKTGTLIVGAAVTGFHSRYLQHVRFEGARQAAVSPNIAKEIEFITMEDIRIAPKAVRVYNHHLNRVRLQASSGSGYYKFSTNNTDAVSLSYEEGGNYVDVIPKSKATVQVSVSDICSEGSSAASAIVNVVDVSRITLHARDMIKVGDQTDIEVTIYDSNGDIFDDAQQIRLMKFTITESNDLVDVDDVPKNSRYTMRGVALGTSTITFRLDRRDGSKVVSEPLTIHVFPAFSLQPKQLILLPDCSYQIQWTGGPPLRAEVTFHTDDTSIATVNSHGLVKGVSLGKTYLHAEIVSTDSPSSEKVVFGRDSIELTVRQLSDIKLFSHTTKILVGEEIVLRITGAQGETPFTYASCASPIKFRWDVVNTEVLSLAPIYEAGNVTLDSEAGFSVKIKGKSAGRTRVSAEIISAPRRVSALHSVARTEIQVIQPLQVIFPPPCKRLLLLPSSQVRIITNKDHTNKLKYQALSATGIDLLTVDQRGNVVTKNQEGVTTILITDHEVSLQLPSVVIQVVIKHPQVLKLIPVSPLSAIPIGQTLTIALHLGDDLGSVFDSYDGVSFGYQLNSADIVSVQIDTTTRSVLVKALRPGEAILRVYVKGYPGELDDYIILKVGGAIYPNTPTIHIGGTVKFSLQIKDARDSKQNLWSSADPSIVAIDAISGVGEARLQGSTIVSNNITSFALNLVTVTPVDRIELDIHQTPISNVIDKTIGAPKEYRLPVMFYGSGQSLKFKRNEVDHSIIFQCRSLDKELATARAEKDPDTGEDFCVVTATLASEIKVIPAYWPSGITIAVTATDKDETYSFEHRQTIPYVPAFFLTEIAGPHITLTTEQKSITFEVHHNKPNTITASTGDPARLHVSQISQTRDGVVYELRVVQDKLSFDNIVVEIFSLESHQRELFYVSYVKEDTLPHVSDSATPEASESRFYDLISSMLLLLAFTIGAAMLFSKMFGPTSSSPAAPVAATSVPPKTVASPVVVPRTPGLPMTGRSPILSPTPGGRQLSSREVFLLMRNQTPTNMNTPTGNVGFEASPF